jgi:hypothetical protein
MAHTAEQAPASGFCVAADAAAWDIMAASWNIAMSTPRPDDAFEPEPPTVYPVPAAPPPDSDGRSRPGRPSHRPRTTDGSGKQRDRQSREPSVRRRRPPVFPVGLVVILTASILAVFGMLALAISWLQIGPQRGAAPVAAAPAFPGFDEPPVELPHGFIGRGELPEFQVDPPAFVAPPPAPPAPLQREPFAPQGRLLTLDLKPKINWLRDEAIDLGDNDLGNLPMGESTFAGVKFNVQGGALLLGGRPQPPSGRPLLMADIAPAPGKFERLYAFHGAHYSLFGQIATIGGYRLIYRDGTSADLPIVYGEDVMDWFFGEHSRVERSRAGWMGRNGASAITFYVTRYDNPHPAKEVAAIDFYATNAGAAPFCLGLTIERVKE